MKLFGVQFDGRYACFDSQHKCVSKKLFKTIREAEDYIPEYRKHVIDKCKTEHKGFYELDETLPMKCKVIDFELDE